MALLDFNGISHCEAEALKGEPNALYTLGLAYCTGQGVSIDLVAAHKWFNLAAMQGSREARDMRGEISQEMNAIQIAEAQRQAREWLASRH
ncbi:MAG TPA: hypothetical protein PLA85_02330 [Micropepsaceae bacterium]|nr:hypothetical protein [Micropepsaceae bacterium]HRK70396.1 hypothetical protein [Micropepsaceae bacterium]